MASEVGVWSQVNADGSVSQTATTMSSSLSSMGSTKSKTTIDVDGFLQLMVAEMQNQDPLEPTDNSKYMAQLATFTQVEATTEMNDNQIKQTASNLVGKYVIMKTSTNNDGFVGGKVDYWEEISDVLYLGIGDKLYDIKDLDTVMDDEYFDVWSAQ
ncbi:MULTISPECIES: flagellar hook capping FlgD N-terminal domain-containing protein [Lachnospira]|jgi:flagellar basal-body rod modification protein FlgD|uniref:Flagellar basal-body rod modification protein FlgD n=1 Tax=Lachnospira multipara TaxID=28051 RepID=A0A1H5UQV1_9FIRM|nr:MULTISPECIES: flagellar hook capping FlgD N-terminal domain-containing protein [Lachnospira]SEF77409.1 flagellar basal-body rod modification protein FlgD [Lachnospira multipara]